MNRCAKIAMFGVELQAFFILLSAFSGKEIAPYFTYFIVYFISLTFQVLNIWPKF